MGIFSLLKTSGKILENTVDIAIAPIELVLNPIEEITTELAEDLEDFVKDE